MALMRLPLAAATLVVLAACGSTPAPSPTPVPPTPTPAPPTPTPTPAPDTERVDVVATGVGSYLITVIPVAVVHNAATAHAVTGITVRFTVMNSAGKPIGGTDVPIPLIAPGQTMGIAGRIEQQGTGLRATAVVIGGQWSPAGTTPPLTVAGVTYTCGSCGSASGYGTASGTLTAAPGVAVNTITLTGVCYDAHDAIIGGGSGATSVSRLPSPVQEAVIVDSPPARCTLYASPGSS